MLRFRFCASAIFLAAILLGTPLLAQTFQGLTIREQTGSIDTYLFSAGDPRIYTSLGYTLSSSVRDFGTSATEYYDVFFSDANGNPAGLTAGDPLPAVVHLTFVCWDGTGSAPDVAPNWVGAGNNLESVTMRFSGGTLWYAQSITYQVWGNCNIPLPNNVRPMENLLGPPDGLIIGMGGGHSVVTVRMGPQPVPSFGSIRFLDAAPRFLNGTDITESLISPGNVCTGGTYRTGATTDGTSRLLIRYEAPGPGAVTATLSGSGSELGTLTLLSGDVQVETHTVSTSAGHQAHLVYTPPDIFSDPEEVVHIRFVPDAGGNAIELEKKLTLKRPPVIFVHGLLETPGYWQKFLDGNQNRSFHPIDFTFRVDRLPFQILDILDLQIFGFRGLVLSNLLQLEYFEAIREERNSGFACDQVDVVCHSMGGLTVRSWTKVDYFQNNDDAFGAEGVINSLITIGTPHFGTPISDKLIDSNVLAIIAKLLAPITDAVYETQELSEPIRGLGATAIPSHTVCGGYSINNSTDTWNTYSDKSIPMVMEILRRSYLFPSPSGVFGISVHDGFISALSASGGLDGAKTTLYSDKQAGTHWDFVDSYEVINRVYEVLNSGAKSDFFAEALPDPGSQTMLASVHNASNRGLSQYAQPSIDQCANIVSPAENTSIVSGQSIPIRVSTQGLGCLWIGAFSNAASVDIDAGTGQGTLSVAQNASGLFTVSVIALTADSTICVSGPMTLYAIPGATLQTLEAMPKQLTFRRPGEHRRMVISGMYSDGLRRLANSHVVGTHYSFSNPGIASIADDGMVTAQRSGVTTLLITNLSTAEQELVQVAVEDNAPNAPPIADAGGPYEVSEGEEVCLNASGSTDPDTEFDSELAYLWDIDGDGEYVDATGVSPCFHATTPGERKVYVKVFDSAGESSIDSATFSVSGPTCEQPILSLLGYRQVSWVDPLWTVQVEVRNAGPGTAKNVNVTMNEELAWLTIPDPNCAHGDIAVGTSTWGNDSYTFDLTAHPGGSFNVWFDVTYEDDCGNQYRLRLDPDFDPATTETAPVLAYRLGQNYPNPFNPSTTISFQLAAAGRVSLSIYDVAGKLVRTLVHEDRSAGLNVVSWDGKDNSDVSVASGIYFYKIQAGLFAETKKMVLMR